MLHMEAIAPHSVSPCSTSLTPADIQIWYGINMAVSEDQRRARNRIAQRKHRARMRNKAIEKENQAGDSLRRKAPAISELSASSSLSSKTSPGLPLPTTPRPQSKSCEVKLEGAESVEETAPTIDAPTCKPSDQCQQDSRPIMSTSHSLNLPGAEIFPDHTTFPFSYNVYPIPPQQYGNWDPVLQPRMYSSSDYQAISQPRMSKIRSDTDTQYFERFQHPASNPAQQYTNPYGFFERVEFTNDVSLKVTEQVSGGSTFGNKDLPSINSRATNLEDKFSRIIYVVEDSGFDSIDSMAAQYYSTAFKQDSIPYWAQATSKSRDLRQFLTTLRVSALSWDENDARGYREEIIRSAESIYANEVRGIKQKGSGEPRQAFGIDQTNSNSGSSRPSIDSREVITPHQTGILSERFNHLLSNSTSSMCHMQQEKKLMRQQIPETWSLLTKLARTAGLSPHQSSQLVFTFLHLLSSSSES